MAAKMITIAKTMAIGLERLMTQKLPAFSQVKDILSLEKSSRVKLIASAVKGSQVIQKGTFHIVLTLRPTKTAT